MAKHIRREYIVNHINRSIDLEGPVSAIIERLKRLSDIGPLEEISIQLDRSGNNIDVNITHTRRETDAEFIARCNTLKEAEDEAKKKRAVQRAKDRVARKALYEKLKKEFE